MTDVVRMICVLSAWPEQKTRDFIIENFHMQFWNNTQMSGVLNNGTKFHVFLATSSRDVEKIRGHVFESIIQLGVPDPYCVATAEWCVR